MKNILFVMGTRPEAIKLAPLISEARKNAGYRITVCSTGQHGAMLSSALGLFGITPDIDLRVMTENQSLSALTARIVAALDGAVREAKPDWMIVQGDTASVFAAGIAAFYNRVRLGHVEAGLRTHDLSGPFPEEMNRRYASMVATLHFAPTAHARDNLLHEGVPADRIAVTGNTVIDALSHIRRRLDSDDDAARENVVRAGYQKAGSRPFVLVTGHRRENLGAGLDGVCRALRTLAQSYPQVDFVYPVHLNPQVCGPVYEALGGVRNIVLLPPVDYLEIAWLMKHARCIVTDSGGMQEEAPVFKKPLIVTRETTERTELVGWPGFQLAGCDPAMIFAGVARWLDMSPVMYSAQTALITNPFGDGQAVPRIMRALADFDAQGEGAAHAVRQA